MRRRMLAPVIAIVATATALAMAASAQQAPATPARIAEITLRAIPTTVTYRGRSVRVRYPSEPEVRALGGSGGPIIHIDITSPAGTSVFVFETQGIGLALVESGADWPAFEVWSNAGGGIYTRAVYTWRAGERQYCAERVDEFEDHGDETATAGGQPLIGGRRFVRFARSRPFGCDQ